MTRRCAFLLVTVAFLATACSGGGTGTPAAPEGTPAVAVATQDDEPEGGVPPTEASAPSQPAATAPTDSPNGDGAAGGATTANGEATPASEDGERHNNGVMTITLSADCVREGDVLLVTLQGPPRAGLGMVVAYSDHQPHTAMRTAESDDNGQFVWTVTVVPTVPPGPARVLATTTGPDWGSEGGGSADREFRVAGAEGC